MVASSAAAACPGDAAADTGSAESTSTAKARGNRLRGAKGSEAGESGEKVIATAGPCCQLRAGAEKETKTETGKGREREGDRVRPSGSSESKILCWGCFMLMLLPSHASSRVVKVVSSA